MNNSNVYVRLTEIAKAAKEAAAALNHDREMQFALSVDVIEAHLQAIRAEMRAREADQMR